MSCRFLNDGIIANWKDGMTSHGFLILEKCAAKCEEIRITSLYLEVHAGLKFNLSLFCNSVNKYGIIGNGIM